MSLFSNINTKVENGGYRTNGINSYATTPQIYPGVTTSTDYYAIGPDRCNYTSQWSNKEQINDCVKCVSNYGQQGEKQSYCNGTCMSKYNIGQLCSDGSLYAANVGQCSNPCYSSFPTTTGKQICSSEIDCSFEETCTNGLCTPNPYILSVLSASGSTGMTGMTGDGPTYYNDNADYSGYIGSTGANTAFAGTGYAYTGPDTSNISLIGTNYTGAPETYENFEYDYALDRFSSRTNFYDKNKLYMGVL
jgi:hypothetical protein